MGAATNRGQALRHHKLIHELAGRPVDVASINLPDPGVRSFEFVDGCGIDMNCASGAASVHQELARASVSLVGGRMIIAPWEGIGSNYRPREGMQVLFTGEVAWMRPEGRKPYFVGTVTALGFEFAP